MGSIELTKFHALYGREALESIAEASKIGNGNVLAIARKGPRLIELYKRISPSITNYISVFSDRALPFMSISEFKSNVVPIFDDIIIYGSTMKRVIDAVVTKGMIGIPVVVAMDQTSINPLFVNPSAIRGRIAIRRSEVGFYSTELVREIRSIGKP